ncbi:M20 family metallopeptidase [Pseudalkalibacillus caeni]|uniref:M20 family metallopeptidase n=1 Tax=Exobacillus caeni TaxID=2574798 RepID=A0A5R9F9S3_9BACL|nr:M20 family metallopeptidase [Pseudalkalibacillus caeni]TLS37603.1 M20 family metallopeptidase [Pseudalkalibacillus caeni]
MENYLNYKKEEMISLLEKLVNIDSGTYYKKGVDKLGLILKDRFEEAGLKVDIHSEEKYGNCLEIKSPENKYPDIIIIAHMDTVFEEGEAEKRPFTISGDKAYGPGVNDEKASLVSLLYAIKALKKNSTEAYKNVHIILNSDEEVGSPISTKIIKTAAENKKYAIVLECGRPFGGLVTARKGVGTYTMNIKGKSAHAGAEAKKGINAIYELSQKVNELQKLNGIEEGISVNVGKIDGGTSANTIPAHAHAKIDVRVENHKQINIIKEKITKIADKSFVDGTTTELTGGIERLPMKETEDNKRLFHIVERIGKEMGLDLKAIHTGGASDASITSNLGIPTIDGMGPVGENSHSETDEYTELATFVERTLLLAKTIEALTG